MDRIFFDVGDSNSWNPVWQDTIVSASAPGGRRYYPISRIEVPVQFTASVLAIYAASETARPNWKSAGFLNQFFRTGITVGGKADASYLGSHHIFLRQINIVQIPTPKFGLEYSLNFDVRPWHEDIYLQVWEFTGEINNVVNDLIIDEVLSRLINVELMVDDIHNHTR